MKKSLGAKTILYPTPVFIVGTYDKEGKPNVMTAAWGGIACSVPPCVAVSLRKPTYSYGSIVEQKAFTISLPSEDYVKEADYFGMMLSSALMGGIIQKIGFEKGFHLTAVINFLLVGFFYLFMKNYEPYKGETITQ